MPTIIAFHPSGFEIRFDVTLDDIPSMITKLSKRHYQPSRAIVYTADGLPLCPKHGVPMQKREKQGDTWYSHKLADPLTGEVTYCRGYAGPSSLGYAIEPDSPAPASVGNGRSTTKPNGQAQPQQGKPVASKPNGQAQRQPTKPAAKPQRANGRNQQPGTLAAMNLDELNEALFG